MSHSHPERSGTSECRILAATDGSPLGDHAAAVGWALAQMSDGEYRRLTVDSQESAPEPAGDWTGGPVGPNGALATARGLPGIEIVRHAEAWGASLVVLGRTQRSPGQQAPLGRTADTVIRRHSGPALFVPPEVQTVRRALISLDGSLRGLGVLAPAAEFLNLVGAQASAACVLPGARSEAADTVGWRDPRSERTCALVDRIQLVSGPCELLVRWGAPVPEILGVIREIGADLLVIGVRGGGQRGDYGSGYVGRELLKSARCAVLTVPI